MSHFDDLRQLFGPWQTKWFEDYMQHKRLPPRIAREFGNFLGAPADYNGTDNSGARKKIRYGFAWKQDNNGDTLIVSPEPLIWLDALCVR
jgi:hypothetical protein